MARRSAALCAAISMLAMLIWGAVSSKAMMSALGQ
jgi:hypothetical protein